jgi:hypothetical protein
MSENTAYQDPFLHKLRKSDKATVGEVTLTGGDEQLTTGSDMLILATGTGTILLPDPFARGMFLVINIGSGIVTVKDHLGTIMQVLNPKMSIEVACNTVEWFALSVTTNNKTDQLALFNQLTENISTTLKDNQSDLNGDFVTDLKDLRDLIALLQGDLTPQGAWNADTNTPDIDAVATTGDFWIVSVAGATPLDGITDWEINDWAVKTATGWAKVDNTDSVTADSITEFSNKSFSDAVHFGEDGSIIFDKSAGSHIIPARIDMGSSYQSSVNYNNLKFQLYPHMGLSTSISGDFELHAPNAYGIGFYLSNVRRMRLLSTGLLQVQTALYEDLVLADNDIPNLKKVEDLIEAAGGTEVHNELTGREVADAHPISAITDLQTELNAKALASSLANYLLLAGGTITGNFGQEGIDLERVMKNSFNTGNKAIWKEKVSTGNGYLDFEVWNDLEDTLLGYVRFDRDGIIEPLGLGFHGTSDVADTFRNTVLNSATAIISGAAITTGLAGKLGTTAKAADSSKLNGVAESEASVANTVVKRTANKYIYGSSFFMSAALRSADPVDFLGTEGSTGKIERYGQTRMRTGLGIQSYGQIYIDAGAMVPTQGSGATPDTPQWATYDVNMDAMKFDYASNQFAQFKLMMPDDWNRGQVKFKCFWTAKAGSAGQTSYFGLGLRHYRNSDPIDAINNTFTYSPDAIITLNDMHITPAVGVTPVGVGALGSMLQGLIIGHTTGTVVNDVYLLGVGIQYTKLTTQQGSW